MQINRLIEIVFVLLRKNTVTAAELAEQFGVSQRTIYRDIDVLSLAGIPVYTEKGRAGGIRLLEEFVLNKSMLSADEQSEIISALQGLSAVKSADTEQVLNKLGSLFGNKTANWIEVDYTDWSFQNGDIFQQLKSAILEKRIAEFDYYNSYGEKSFRRVEPIQLWFKSKAWYLKAFCLGKNDVRTFKITRIRGLKVDRENFPERNLLQAVAANQPERDYRPDITLRLVISEKRAYRVYDELDQSKVVKNADGSFSVTVTWPEDDWVYDTILSYGEHITVLEPEHIRGIIRERAKKIAEKY